MRATQFVRRGLVAFAAVATVTFGLSGVASAQGPGGSPGAVVDPFDNAAISYVPVPGYDYDVVTTDGARTAVLAVGGPAADNAVVVQFLPEFGGAAIVDPVNGNLIAEDAADYAAALLAELGG
jgi:hypothetical protein